MKYLLIILLSGLSVLHHALAKDINSLELFYDELEVGAGAQVMRYIINEQYLRIDNGDDKADYILFNTKNKTIYSVNHEDQTILKIENKPWNAPAFDFKSSIKQEEMTDAPKISAQSVYLYSVNAGDKACTQVFLLKGKYEKYMNVLYQYQQVLNGQQVATLKNTPKEYHTPCFLLDQIYHSAEYYKMGFPVRIKYSRGYEKNLRSFKESKFDEDLFLKPEDYKEYTAAF